MLKRIPIFWKLSAAFFLLILIILILDFSFGKMVDLKFDENLRTFILILIASILSCGTAWLIVHLFISRSVHKLSNSMSELADKKFNFSLDDKKKDEFSSFTSSFSDLSNIISYFQTEINKSRDYLEGIVESTSDIIITVNPTGKILTFNTGAEKALGFQRYEVVGKTIEMLWANPSERDAAIDRLKYGDNVVNIETKFLTKSDEIRDVLLTLSLMRNPKGEMIGTFGISKDITDVKRLQNQLIQSQRYIAIGEVFTGIQHSLKNMLNALKGGSYMVRTGLAKDNRKMLEEGWGIVQEGIDRMTNMSSDMLKFVKSWVPKLAEVNLADSLHGIENVIKKSAADKEINFQMNILEDFPTIKCDIEMIHSTIMDIVSNALDACQWKDYDKGEVPLVTVNTYLNNGEREAIIEIKDNGCGMTNEVKSNIFTPFYSTKSTSGTGLGLSIASRMINAHHGRINVESEPDIGTLFQIILPIDANNKIKEINDGKKSSGS